ncbi:ribonuclease J [Mycoplasma iguanae]|uniref:Ribonuclease J n=1 Tax=Mycoplasma iguanae TaxID=292461 RepID=A0ABY5R9H2_9MOLU|nr:ribonuclease J [Mycoplasma iguanae]UVD81971.1 ribonuclease J [Mycoplasma iguanae]
MAKINFFALGGLDENGKNCYVLEVDNDLYIINSGTKVPISSVNGVDTLIPDFKFLEKNQKRIKGVFLTDVKNESFSAIPWLLMRVKNLKIYCSVFSKFIVLERLSKYKIGHNNFEVISLIKRTQIGMATITPISVAGALPGINGYNFETADGNILFLLNLVVGNLGLFGNTNLNFIKKVTNNEKPLLALFLDSGKSNLPGKSIDKIGITSKIEKVFQETKEESRIIIGAYDEEMFILNEVLTLAQKNDRPVIIYGRNYSQLLELSIRINKEQKMPKFLEYKYANKTKNAVILVVGKVERLYQRFLRITEKNDVFLKLKSEDSVIMIAPPVNGLEVTHALTLDEIARISKNLIDVSESEYYPLRPAKEDIAKIVSFLKPEHFIPLQGLYRYLVVASQEANKAGVSKAKSYVLQNGKTLSFVDGKLFSQKGFIKDAGETIIDGFGVGDISHEVIRERETLGRDGVISISSLLNYKTKKIEGEINIISSGTIIKEIKTEIHDMISSIFIQVCNENNLKNLKDVQEKIRKVVRKLIFKKIDKEPIVLVTFYEY